jgi:pimeloyl-ACP methyl ester carboxylesterase
MKRHDESRRTQVQSRDGTQIGYFSSGQGPSLLLVHGSVSDHHRWAALLPYLEPHFTVHAMDRRGRGASGDREEWAIEREYEDVAVVVDGIAADSGSPVYVYGNSYGGICAFGGAALTSNIRKLVLYEGWPPVYPANFAPPEGFLDRAETLLAAGDLEGVVEITLLEAAKLPREELAAFKAQSSWSRRVAAAHTLPREERAFYENTFSRKQAAKITVPTLLLSGSESPDWYPEVEIVAAALPDAQIEILKGQGHGADITAPEMVAERLLAFLQEQS